MNRSASCPVPLKVYRAWPTLGLGRKYLSCEKCRTLFDPRGAAGLLKEPGTGTFLHCPSYNHYREDEEAARRVRDGETMTENL